MQRLQVLQGLTTTQYSAISIDKVQLCPQQTDLWPCWCHPEMCIVSMMHRHPTTLTLHTCNALLPLSGPTAIRGHGLSFMHAQARADPPVNCSHP